jgi:hypothetical protein
VTNISQAAKERAVKLANEDSPGLRHSTEVLPRNPTIFALAKYIDKVSAIADEASQSVVSDKDPYEMLHEWVVKDVDPLPEILLGLGFVIYRSNAESISATLREAISDAGYKIVKDEG